MLTGIDAVAVDRHWRTQLDFERPAEGHALRAHGLSAALDQLAFVAQDGDPFSFPQFAYLAPAGTIECLWKSAGRRGDFHEHLFRKLATHGPGGAQLVRAMADFSALDVTVQCRVISALLECALYDTAAALVEAHDIDLDPASGWGAWCLYQIARLQQRFDGVLGSPDEFFATVAESAPFEWQRAAAMGQLVARYSRIAPSRDALSHWCSRAQAAADGLDASICAVNALWASRLCRALALGHSVAGDVGVAASALARADSFHVDAVRLLPGNAANRYLLAMNERLLVEAQLKLSQMTGGVRVDLAHRIVELDPGCADAWYFAGNAFLKAGNREGAMHALMHSWSLGTPRNVQTAVALARLWSGRDEGVAREWACAASRAAVRIVLPSDVALLSQKATHAA